MAAATSSSLSSATSYVIVESLNAADNDGRMVRFDSECVLIPEYSRKRPRVVTKSLSLPLWKRRPEYTADETTQAVLSSSPEETHVVLRVPIPSFVRRSRSPPRSPSISPTIPLSPCLVQRSPPLPPFPSISTSPELTPRKPSTLPQSPTLRRPSLPIYQRRPDDQTVPLRPCCPDCVPITDKCLKEGPTWQEKFTKGARRRRSASLDSTSSSGILGGGNNRGQKSAFVPATVPLPASFDARIPPRIAITVDEVDKRRRSQDFSGMITGHRSASPTLPFEHRDRDHHTHTAESSGSSSHTASSSLLNIDSTHINNVPRKSSPIVEEEDESELFPLPSPRRSPSGSRSSSTKSSPRNSPNASSSCLHPSMKKAVEKTSSKESVSSDQVLAGEVSRKDDNPETQTKRKPSLTLTPSKPHHQEAENMIPTAPNSPVSPTPITQRTPSFASSSTSVSSTSPRFAASSAPKRKISSSFGFITNTLKGASADVLRGVSSISGGTSTMSM